jgi:hypothetical protein
MLSTKDLDINYLESKFFENKIYFSYSSLNKLLINPLLFYKEYILLEKDEETYKHLIEGTLIHYLILEHQGFDDKFLVTPDKLPSDNIKQVLDKVYKIYLEQGNDQLTLSDFEDQIDDMLREVDLYQAIKDKDKRIGKVLEQKCIEYFEFLKRQDGRLIIDSATLDSCTERANIVKNNSKMRELLGLDLNSDGINYGVYNELELRIEAEENKLFGYKGIIDNIVVDVKKKKVYINDFKTTSKSLTLFSESVTYWNYWLQAALYLKLVRNYLKSVLKDDWVIEFRFIVFDRYNMLYAFEVTEETIASWLNELNKVEKIAEYHCKSRDFTLPYDYALGIVKL